MTPQQKKTVIAVLLLLVAGGVYYFYARSPSPLPGSIRFVDITSGDFVNYSRGSLPNLLPAKNSDGVVALFPVLEREGKYFVDPHYGYALQEPEFEEVNKYVDPRTFEVLDSPRN